MAPQDRDPLNIVILGGSFAGLACAHRFLRGVEPQLQTVGTSSPAYKVTLVSPSSHLYWRFGAPRAIVSQKLIPHSTSFIPILQSFEDYPPEKFQFVQGTAVNVDPSARVVIVSLARSARGSASTGSSNLKSQRWSAASRDSNLHSLPYHALIIATGTSTHSPLLSLSGPHEQTEAALNAFHARLPAAESIIIAGGGPSGIETAGQLASYFNTTTKWPSAPAIDYSQPQPNMLRRAVNPDTYRHSSQKPDTDRRPKSITIISGSSRLLPKLEPTIGAKAEQQLRGLGVHIIHNTRLISAQESPSGNTRCVLSDNTTIAADLYVAATGVQPNTSYLPKQFLDSQGYVVADPGYLRVYPAGDRVYAIGDCASYSKKYVLDIYDALPALMTNLRNDLVAFELQLHDPYGEREAEIASLKHSDIKYKQKTKDTQIIPITRCGGVGVIQGKRIPGIMVHILKGRDYKVRSALAACEGYNPYAPNRAFD